MNIRIRNARTAAAALAAGAAVALTVPSATAAPATSDVPQFLAPSELPPHPRSPWYAGPVTAGQPDWSTCVGEALPSTSRHREFWTDMDTTAQQVTVVERNVRRAKNLAALLRKDIAGCAEKATRENPDMTATDRYYGRLNVEEGAHVYGIHSETTWGANDITLLSVGRDGRTVTFVNWGQIGNFQHAQVGDFKRTTVTAVNKLY